MKKIYKSATELIGGTPLLEVTKIEEKLSLNATILAKLEAFNPAGSIKDRAALYMIEDAEKEGILKENSVIIEATSGNTGIGLCCVAAIKGYKVIIVMPENMSEERKMLISAYGASLVLTPAADGMDGAICKANELLKEIPGSIIAGQFTNPANPKAHYDTTGREIFDDTDGCVDIFVCGVGTGGTITGTGRYLKEKKEDIKVVAVEPAGSPVLSGGKKGAHGLQGIGAGFVPEVLDTSVYDSVEPVTEEEAFEYARLLAKKEGILAGISSGAALCAAVKECKKTENANKTVVVLLPDTGERYLTTDLFKR
jgi:cysteine synthase A